MLAFLVCLSKVKSRLVGQYELSVSRKKEKNTRHNKFSSNQATILFFPLCWLSASSQPPLLQPLYERSKAALRSAKPVYVIVVYLSLIAVESLLSSATDTVTSVSSPSKLRFHTNFRDLQRRAPRSYTFSLSSSFSADAYQSPSMSPLWRLPTFVSFVCLY